MKVLLTKFQTHHRSPCVICMGQHPSFLIRCSWSLVMNWLLTTATRLHPKSKICFDYNESYLRLQCRRLYNSKFSLLNALTLASSHLRLLLSVSLQVAYLAVSYTIQLLWHFNLLTLITVWCLLFHGCGLSALSTLSNWRGCILTVTTPTDWDALSLKEFIY